MHCCHLSGDEFVIVWETKFADRAGEGAVIEEIKTMLSSIQGKIKCEDADPHKEFPRPGRMTISAALVLVFSNFNHAKERANKNLDVAKKNRATIHYVHEEYKAEIEYHET